MAKRKIIKIDEEKCNGCGLCIPNCPEGALQIIDGKARLISDLFCDGLGACLGHCPQGAITIEERESEGCDERKVKEHLQGSHTHEGGCPGSQVIDLRRGQRESQLGQWPVQIMLVPPNAPYFTDADLLITADCVPFAYASFHEDLLRGKILLVGCPKLDDIEVYKERISQIIRENSIKSVAYAHMEVPCCFGLVGVIQGAISESGKKIPFEKITISIKGKRLK